MLQDFSEIINAEAHSSIRCQSIIEFIYHSFILNTILISYKLIIKLAHIQVNTMSSQKAAMVRRQKDIFKLRTSKYNVEASSENQSTLLIDFLGPPDTPYELGKWKITLYLPDQYPYKSPSVGFFNKIYHPNIDYSSGSVCLDVINQTWTPMYELLNIFEIFLPQLLTYPNPASPLNQDAAKLYEEDIEKYNEKVKQCILKHALNLELVQQRKKSQIEEIMKKKEEANLRKDSLSRISEPISNQKGKQKKIAQNQEEDNDSLMDEGSSLSQRDSILENDDLKHY